MIVIGLCNKCLGCNRLENNNFYGTFNCKNYIKGVNNVVRNKKNRTKIS